MQDPESILLSIKKLLGITEDYTVFDTDLIMHINSVFLTLSQLGVGPDDGFAITSAENQWSEYMTSGTLLNAVKTYMYLKVRLLFDPPTSSSVADSIKNMINELEWRINVEGEHIKEG
jgi:hypothetical protein